MRGLGTLLNLAAIAAGFVEGFVLASLVACVGPLAVLGAFATGLLMAVQRPWRHAIRARRAWARHGRLTA